ncbi:MAG: hypothetical protein Q4F84_10740, partial [Fibrobacter sp.]|nr:hypothetical protein [Fibrobacter sp.]
MRNWTRFRIEYRWIKESWPIVEISRRDDYWGVKADKTRPDYGSGQNILGKMLDLLKIIVAEKPELLKS